MIFARLPEPGRAKTRLAPVLGEEGAADLYRAFLDDAVAMAGRIEADRRELWIPRRPGAGRVLGRRYPALELRWQADGGLGERLRASFRAAFAEGSDLALAVGSDHPTLPPEHLRLGFRRLREADVVLGPARDGGYYAVGLRRRAWPEGAVMFRDVPWSTERVLEVTLGRAREIGLRAVELPRWYDVDEPGELARLRAEARPGSATERALTRLLPTDG